MKIKGDGAQYCQIRKTKIQSN
uniref:Uncharacterized protein n=1 Tax=Rhizophora mucronata TaxID=61149 RepID=A0A2P2P3L0_RHIMU